jgi:hypothetical protein
MTASVETSLTGGTTLRNFGLVARYDVTDKIRFSADVFQSRRESYNSISAAQILTSGLTGAYPGRLPRAGDQHQQSRSART